MNRIHHDAERVKSSELQLSSAYPHLTGHPFVVPGGKPSGFLVDMGDHNELWRKDKDHLRNWPGPGLCFDLGALAEAERLNVSIIRIKYLPTNCEYITHIKAVREHGVEFDRGWGRQICLRFGFWTKINPDGTVEQPSLPKRQPAPVAEQPALFVFDEPVRRGGY